MHNMKRFILLIMLLMPLGGIAQEISFDSIMSEYSSKEGCTTMRIGKGIFNSMEIKIDADSMSIISVEDSTLIPQFKAQIATLVAPMEVLMSVNYGIDSVDVYRRSSDGQVKELLIVTNKDNVSAAIYIIGTNLEVNQINSIINIF